MEEGLCRGQSGTAWTFAKARVILAWPARELSPARAPQRPPAGEPPRGPVVPWSYGVLGPDLD